MFFNNNHNYSLVLVNGPRRVDEVYQSRNAANDRMYKLLGELGLRIEKIYDDKHDKTYICHDGSHFHINRI